MTLAGNIGDPPQGFLENYRSKGIQLSAGKAVVLLSG